MAPLIMTTPALVLPVSKGSTVRVSVIQAGRLEISMSNFFVHKVQGHDVYHAPCYSFLIENDQLGKKVLFDLGLMKAWKEKLPPVLKEQMNYDVNAVMEVTADVADQFRNNGIPLESISDIIWSHHHIDHIGDATTFPASTRIIVGPGFKSNELCYPGYPVNPDAEVPHDALEGREIFELDFESSSLEIGGLKSIDYFGDGSLYLLQTPGHTFDHISGLARTSEGKFVLMAGDTAHSCSEFRPSIHQPLPEFITPSPFDSPHSQTSCPCALFYHVQEDYLTKAFQEANSSINIDKEEASASLRQVELFDACPDVFVIMAHDNSLLDILPFFPHGELTGWDKTSDKQVGTWRFLRDYKDVVGIE